MPSQDKAMTLEACHYSDLAKCSKVFNLDATEYHLWIYMNPEEVRTAYFIGAQEIGPNADNSRIFPDTFERESQCWIRVNRGYISSKPGKHTIKLSFVDRYTDTDFSLYVSYFMQVTNPEKPYVYMKPKEEVYEWGGVRPDRANFNAGLTPYTDPFEEDDK